MWSRLTAEDAPLSLYQRWLAADLPIHANGMILAGEEGGWFPLRDCVVPDEEDAKLPWLKPILAGELGEPVAFVPPSFDEGLCALARQSPSFNLKRVTPGGVRASIRAALSSGRALPFAYDKDRRYLYQLLEYCLKDDFKQQPSIEGCPLLPMSDGATKGKAAFIPLSLSFP